MLTEEFSCIEMSISCTTRPPRPGEIPGKHYEFLSVLEFQEKISRGDFLEHAQVFGHHYGTLRTRVETQRAAGKHIVLVIDTQGALQLKGKIPAIFIFIKPPSLTELKKRLQRRKTELPEVIEERLAQAKHEIDAASHYDYCIVNDHLMVAYEVLRSIVIAEEHRTP
jgi:guanylate kinase